MRAGDGVEETQDVVTTRQLGRSKTICRRVAFGYGWQGEKKRAWHGQVSVFALGIYQANPSGTENILSLAGKKSFQFSSPMKLKEQRAPSAGRVSSAKRERSPQVVRRAACNAAPTTFLQSSKKKTLTFSENDLFIFPKGPGYKKISVFLQLIMVQRWYTENCRTQMFRKQTLLM